MGKTADSLWQPVVAGTVACFLSGIGAFWLGRRLGHGSLEKIRWLHLTPERLMWPERFFERHGAKTVIIARFIFLFPPVAANLLTGMGKMQWRTFLFYNLTGSAAYTTGYTLLGYFFREEVETARSLAGSHRALPDAHGDSHCGFRSDFQTFCIRVLGAPFSQKQQQK